MLRPYAKRLRAYVDGLGKPLSHVIVSHGHPDHYFGLEFFADQPTYALKDTIARMHRRSAGHQAAHKEKEGAQVIDTIVYPAHELPPGRLQVDGVDLDCEELQGGEDVTQLHHRGQRHHLGPRSRALTASLDAGAATEKQFFRPPVDLAGLRSSHL